MVETPLEADRDLLLATYPTLDPAVYSDTICWIVLTEGEDEFLYFGPEPECDLTPVSPQPVTIALFARNFPNPFNPRTTVEFNLPAAEPDLRAHLRPQGRLVRTLVDGEALAARTHTRIWDGKSDTGRSVASGVYLLRVDANRQSATSRMILLR